MDAVSAPSRWILLAHGSRLEAANQEVRSLAARVAKKLGARILPAFLESAAPSLADALDQAIAEQARSISILPYFLTQGRHLSEDIPKLIGEKRRAHPQVSIRLLDHIGNREEIVDLLAEMARTTR